MEGYFSLKLKRKELEVVNDKFSDFSLTTPARKIRRLDGELPPIVEEEEYEIPLGFADIETQNPSICGGLKIEELPSENEEKAIVVFKPLTIEIPLMKLPSAFPDFSVSLDPQFIAEIKSQTYVWRQAESAVESDGRNSCSNRDCLAIIPWAPFTNPLADGTDSSPQIDNSEMMDVEVPEESAMDVETCCQQTNTNEVTSESHLHQWQPQQHCILPNLTSHNPKSPTDWHR